MTVSYDVTFFDTTDSWMAFRFGTPNSGSFFTVTDVGYTILMRENGDNEIFNGTQNLGSTGIAFTPSVGTPIPVSITYTFDSIANGSTIGVVATANGTTFLDSSFVFKNSTDALYLELVAETGHLVDNFAITTVPEPNTTALLALGSAGILYIGRRLPPKWGSRSSFPGNDAISAAGSSSCRAGKSCCRPCRRVHVKRQLRGVLLQRGLAAAASLL